MPKMKTNRSAAKRFRLTGSGKVVRRKMGMRHILTKKSPKRKRFLSKLTVVDSASIKAVLRMVPKKSMG
jgi:large subunit ribosomal protein L35